MLRVYYFKIKPDISKAIIGREKNLYQVIKDTTEVEHAELMKTAASGEKVNEAQARLYNSFEWTIEDNRKALWKSATTQAEKMKVLEKLLDLV